MKRKEKPTWPRWPASVPPTLLPAALWLVLCLLVAADSLTDQGSADVTKGSVCFKVLPISEVPGDVTKRQCQDHEPLEKKIQEQGCAFCRTDDANTQSCQYTTTPDAQLLGPGSSGQGLRSCRRTRRDWSIHSLLCSEQN